MSRRVSRATLEVLAAFMRDPDGEHYGLEISDATGLLSGSVYPILAQLERDGWLVSRWEDIDPQVEGRRSRRYYRLTWTGRTRAREELATARRTFGLGES